MLIFSRQLFHAIQVISWDQGEKSHSTIQNQPAGGATDSSHCFLIHAAILNRDGSLSGSITGQRIQACTLYLCHVEA